ncbi:cytochrome o ubiquinol oxidase subunit III [Candidatus Schneideria nysicola]|uniref:cytochrome o ubiquinol oxidase subunit III n=1 Tax=Candidatus Schneideria nysicola TaxID=1081631 RepID=UPI001CAA7DF3|nr:cytochrome o ubiquinol oxidase subunit III [Candidatus Schneideria nysicola]UAJ64910.1 cytochrome o ubiquinol oxidase subunit III [Candidatus Schneideria nysicola]
MINKFISNYREQFEETHDSSNNTILGFWIYLMSDCILFATLFSVYFVLKDKIALGPSIKDIVNLPFILLETFILLFSSLTCSQAMYSMKKDKKYQVNFWLILTLILGILFIIMEYSEFLHLYMLGFKPNCSAFLSSFFVLIATHGIHVATGTLWLLLMIVHIILNGLTTINQTRLHCLSLFWHFLDIIWIGVFTLVYLMGTL